MLRLWVTRMRQCTFMNRNKRITLAGGLLTREAVHMGTWEFAVTSAQFCYEAKYAWGKKIFFKSMPVATKF